MAATHNIKPLLLVQALALAFSLPAYADTVPSENERKDTELDTIVVESERQTPPQTTVIKGQDLRRQGAQNMDDLVRYEAGVDVRSDNARIGHGSFNIRGITENQIAISVDGIPIPEANRDLSRGGTTVTGGRDMVETDTLRAVAIQKSGDSAANGNGALGGSVNMQTYSPRDFLTDKNWHFGLRYGYRSSYRSHGLTATLAGRHGEASGLLMLTRRNSREAENYGENDGTGANRTVSNRQRTGQYNILAKADFGTGRHRIETAFEHFNRDTDTDRQDLIAKSTAPGSQAETSASTAEDRYRRNRFSAAYRYLPDSGIFNEAAVRLYYQRAQVLDYADKDGKDRAGQPIRVLDRNSMTQNAFGLRGELSGKLDTGYLNHRFKLALDYRRNQTDRLIHQDYQSAAINQKAANRYYPPSTRQTVGLNLQDRISFPNRTAIDLGLRFEHERTSFDVDQAYITMATGNPTGQVGAFRTIRHNTLLPSVRISHPFTPQLTAFAAYSKGFRSPAAINQAAGFGNNRLRYRVIPNFDLKPETAHNFEAGLRGGGNGVNWKLTAFHNRYTDLITEDTPSAGKNGGYDEFKFINAGRARTYGLEFSGGWQFAPHWKLNGNIAWMRGTQQARSGGAKLPLASAYPLHGSIGLEYARDNWGINTRLSWSAKQNRVPSSQHFRAPGYGVWDVSAFYRPSRNVEMNLSVYNVGNRRYWTYADAARRPADTSIDRYTQPGRNVALGVNITF